VIKLYAPDGAVGASPVARAPSPAVLAGRRIGVLENAKPNARELLTRAAAGLASRTGASVVIVTGKGDDANAATPADDAVLDRLVEEVDLVVTGSAD
jgi:hypothetical protein